MGTPVELKITVPVSLDGRVIAEVVVPYIPDELYRRGV
jgi:phage-related protein